MRPRWGPGVAALVAATLLAGCSGCSRKEEGAPDASAFLASLVDAGDAGRNDAGPDDSAMPAVDDDDLQQRMKHLLEAISQNNPDLANDALFPRDGYVLMKESSDPQKAWDRGISGNYRRSVERIHNRIKGIEHAKYVGFEIGHSIVQLQPSKKNFKKPLWRVRHSKIKFTLEGKERTLDIAEMTAWRGAWYVTKLR
ncbi:MAG: hypothetical protein KIT84_33765 [Labilithrix sp.]|nr:hypothetical protein [Labilithrix sp.]MCW5816016.1 hypothetical protein [Labilithrix sp.]